MSNRILCKTLYIQYVKNFTWDPKKPVKLVKLTICTKQAVKPNPVPDPKPIFRYYFLNLNRN